MNKPGYKTTEFWLTVAAVVVGLLLSSGAFSEGETPYQILSFIASALAALGYSFSRAMVKGSEARVEAAKVLTEGESEDPTEAG